MKNFKYILVFILLLFFISVGNLSNLHLLKDRTTVLEILLGAFLAGLIEEYIFRKIIQGALIVSNKNRTGKEKPLKAIIITSLIFAIIHMLNLFLGDQSLPNTIIQCLSALSAGFLFGALYYNTGSIKITILIHFIFDIGAKISQLGITHTPSELSFYIGDLCMILLNMLLFIDLFKEILFKKTTVNKIDKLKPLTYILVLVLILIISFYN